MEGEVERRPADLPRVREYQREVYESGARFKLLLCGRRWGKSKLGVLAASEEHPAAAEVWDDLKKAVGRVASEVSDARRLIELPGGGSVRVWSGYVPDTLRGPYFDGVIVDECSLQHERLWAAVRPTLSDYGGWALLLGSVPEDVASHWFVTLHRYALTESGRYTDWE